MELKLKFIPCQGLRRFVFCFPFCRRKKRLRATLLFCFFFLFADWERWGTRALAGNWVGYGTVMMQDYRVSWSEIEWVIMMGNFLRCMGRSKLCVYIGSEGAHIICINQPL